MICQDVGSANADIAGIGIILAFTIQGGLSIFLSIWATLLEPRTDRENKGLVYNYLGRLVPVVFLGTNDPRSSPEAQYDAKRMRQLILRLLGTISDAQTLNGISLLIGTLVQHRTLGLYHFHIVFDTVNFTGVSACAALVVVFNSPSASFYRIMSLNIFMALYIGFIIMFGIKLHSWNYDASGACYHTNLIATKTSAHPRADEAYLGITSLYCVAIFALSTNPPFSRLVKILDSSPLTRALEGPSARGWTLLQNGMSSALIASHSPQLFVDMINTRLATLGNLLGPGHSAEQTDDSAERVLAASLVQCPVHGYMLFALRTANEPYLSGDSENQWGFGQVVALVLLLSVITESIRAFVEYKIQKWDARVAEAGNQKQEKWRLLRSLLVEDDAGMQTTELAAAPS